MTPKQKAALKMALEALEDSLGYVEEEAENAQRLYGQYPTRQTRIQGLKDDARKHMDAITAIREALAEQQKPTCKQSLQVEQPAQQQEPVAVYVGETWCGSVVRLYEDLPLETPFYTSPQPSKPLTDEQRKAIVVCFTSGKVSVSEVQRKLAISYNEAQQLCQSIVDLKLAQGLQLAPSLDRHGIKGDA